MTDALPAELKSRLEAHGQTHVLRWWGELSDYQRQRLARQIESLDLERIAGLWASRQHAGQKPQTEDLADVARRAVPPASIVRLPQTPQAREDWQRAQTTGEELLNAGKVGAILVAGGQGTRLGFDKPKGEFPIGPVSQASLFQILAEQVLARSRRAGKPIPYFVMTSDATHEETVAFFTEHKFFGLPPGDVFFFEQGNMPAVDAATGKLLMADKGTLSTSPDGHGGMLAALAKAGLLDEMKRRGIEFLHYHQVDNPTAIVCDPVFLGFHAQRGAEMSIKVVAKRSAGERMGVAVDVDGRTQIIEYSDLPADVAAKTDPQGELLLWAGQHGDSRLQPLVPRSRRRTATRLCRFTSRTKRSPTATNEACTSLPNARTPTSSSDSFLMRCRPQSARWCSRPIGAANSIRSRTRPGTIPPTRPARLCCGCIAVGCATPARSSTIKRPSRSVRCLLSMRTKCVPKFSPARASQSRHFSSPSNS